MRSLKSPLVSVIIPSFNKSKYVGATISSVLTQSFKSLEILVVDDGSTDNTEEVVKKYGPAINFIKIKHTGSPATPRNIGVLRARGELLAFLDSDDIWHAGKLKEQISFMKSGNFDLVYCDGDVVDENGKITKKSFLGEVNTPSGRVFKDLFFANFIPTSTVLVKKSCLKDIGQFNPGIELLAAEDYDMWLRLASKYKFGYLDKRLISYRELPGSFGDTSIIRAHQRELAAVRNVGNLARKIIGVDRKPRLFSLCKVISHYYRKEGNILMWMKYNFLAYYHYPWIKKAKMIFTGYNR